MKDAFALASRQDAAAIDEPSDTNGNDLAQLAEVRRVPTPDDAPPRTQAVKELLLETGRTQRQRRRLERPAPRPHRRRRLTQMPDPDVDVAETAIANIEAEQLRRRVAELPALEARVLRWRYGIQSDELTDAEIARRLGLPRGSIWAIEQRALRRLRRRYGVSRSGAALAA